MLLVPCSESYLSHQHTQSYVSVLRYLSHVVNPICPTNTLNPVSVLCYLSHVVNPICPINTLNPVSVLCYLSHVVIKVRVRWYTCSLWRIL